VKKPLLDRIQSFELLRDNIKLFLKEYPKIGKKNIFHTILLDAVEKQHQQNRWFTPTNILQSLEGVVFMLENAQIQNFIKFYKPYFENENPEIETIFVISAGNFPLAAFHDFFSVLISGNKFLGKMSANDAVLLPVLASFLIDLDPYFKNNIIFIDSIKETPEKINKVIATGSDNSSRYFEYYFGKYPLLLRKNRNSVAILEGNESAEQLKNLAKDILSYFGLGCRSVSKLYLPQNFDFVRFIETIVPFSSYNADHHLYLNNLDFQKTIYLMNRKHFYDAGPFMLVENVSLSSPISILNYEFYSSIKEVNEKIFSQIDAIQCVVTENDSIIETINQKNPHVALKFGKAQSPHLLQYPDGADIIKFCLS
jgi:hypothetical protein